MQTSVGEVLSLLPHDALSTPRYHDNHRSVTMETSAATLTSVTVTTQIEEAHSTTNNGCPSQPQSTEGEVDKKSIYRHPLFPLLALLLEKCEQATQTPDCPSADSFDVDIQAFVQRQEQERRAFFSDDLELDGLMVKAIQVLRIHLLELEKVSELCKDFCSRYISCLKGKLQSEQLLRTDAYDGEQSDDCLLSPGRSPAHNNNNNNNNLSLVLPGQPSTPAAQPIAGLGQGQVVSGGTVYQMVQTPQGLVAQPIQLPPGSQHPGGQSVSAPVVHGSTPLSQIGAQTTPDTSSTQDSPTTPSLPKDFFDDDSFGGRKSKRGVLPKQATQVMKSWLFQHIVHPYPTEDEKRQIAGQTNLTMLQVNNWFINARRRILQPMLDASNPEGPKAKKNKPTQNRPVQRFWPENLANLANMASANQGAGSPSQSPTSTLSPQTQLCVTLEEDEEEEEEDEDQEEEEDSSYDTSLMDSQLVSNYGQHLMMQTTGSVPTLLHPQLLQQPALLSDVASSASAQTLTLTSNVTLRAAEANVTAHSTNLAPLSTPEPGLQAPPPSAAPATDTLRI